MFLKSYDANNFFSETLFVTLFLLLIHIYVKKRQLRFLSIYYITALSFLCKFFSSMIYHLVSFFSSMLFHLLKFSKQPENTHSNFTFSHPFYFIRFNVSLPWSMTQNLLLYYLIHVINILLSGLELKTSETN